MKNLIVGVAAACLLMPVVARAHDDTCVSRGEAEAHIANALDAIEATSFYGKRGKDQSGLVSKALAAKSYVADHKYSDAISKLDDIVTKVTSLLDAPKEKIDALGGELIVDTTIDAMYCVSDLQ